MAVDARFSGGHRRLFWPEDLEEISSPRPWWRSLLGITSAEWVLSGLIILTCLHASQPRSSWPHSAEVLRAAVRRRAELLKC